MPHKVSKSGLLGTSGLIAILNKHDLVIGEIKMKKKLIWL
jgi:hypothetical protein